MCKDDDLGNILQQYKNRAIYVYIHDILLEEEN
jgi:hypothetical protein